MSQSKKKANKKKATTKKVDNLDIFVKELIEICKRKIPVSLTKMCEDFHINKSYATIVKTNFLEVDKKQGKLTIYKNKGLKSNATTIKALKDLLKIYLVGVKAENKINDNEEKIVYSLTEQPKNEDCVIVPVEKSEAEIDEDIKQLKEAQEELKKIDLDERLPEGYYCGMFKDIKERELDELVVKLAYENINDQTLEVAKKLVDAYNVNRNTKIPMMIVSQDWAAEFNTKFSDFTFKIEGYRSQVNKLETELVMAKSNLELKTQELDKLKSQKDKPRGFWERFSYLFSNKLK